MENPDQLLEMANNAYTSVNKQFLVKSIHQKVLKQYNKLLEEYKQELLAIP